jgi:hypothetical protein
MRLNASKHWHFAAQIPLRPDGDGRQQVWAKPLKALTFKRFIFPGCICPQSDQPQVSLPRPRLPAPARGMWINADQPCAAC